MGMSFRQIGKGRPLRTPDLKKLRKMWAQHRELINLMTYVWRDQS